MSQIQVTGEAKIRDLQGPVVANSGVITALDGLPSQYVRGDGTLADIPSVTGGGSSVSYYLNGSVNQGTFGGSTYYQLGESAITGVGTNFSTSTDGLLAQFITDIDVPDVTEIPSGNWNIEFYMGVSASSGALASFYVEIYKYDGTTFTLVGTNVATPEFLTNTTTVDAYFTSVAMPFTVLAQTDRIAIRIYASVAGKTVTMYTEDNRLCQVVTTFSRGMLSLNSLTDQQQYLTVGTAGTDFNIVSALDTHTFNIPSASATNRGLITTGSQTIAGDKTLSGNNTFSANNTFTQDILVNGLTIGKGAGTLLTNTATGVDALDSNTTGIYNSAFGYNSLKLNTTGFNNTSIGTAALSTNTTGYQNTAIGSFSMEKNTTGYVNTSTGTGTLMDNTTGYGNSAFGDGSLASNTTGNVNTAVGTNALGANTTANQNTAVGGYALWNNTTGYWNTAIGASAMQSNSTGYVNTAIGYTSLQSNTTGSGNVAVGYATLESNTTGVNNVGIGQASLLSNTTGNHNTAVGISTLQNTVGSNNTVIGHKAGELIYTGSNNTIVGVYQGTSAMSNNVILADGQGNIRYQFDGTKNIFNNPVDLGAWGLTASGVTANSYNAIGNGTQGGYIYLKQGTTPYAGLVGANGISADGTKFLLISNVSIAQDKVALFDFGSLTNNTARTYTFPDASGTIALTSQLTGGTVTSVSALTIGTTGTNITSTVATGTTTPVITLNIPNASATNRGALTNTDWSTFNAKSPAAGSTSITTLGTITTGTWNGTAIAANRGGTGQTVYVIGDILYASTTTALSRLAGVATGNSLISGGVGVAPAWGKIGLTTHVSGTLAVGNGGTGAATLTGLVKGNGTSAFTAAVAGTDYLLPSSLSGYLPLTGGTLTGTTSFDGSGSSANPITLIYTGSSNRLLAPILRLYGATSIASNYVELLGTNATSNRTVNFPDASGTVILGTGTTNTLPKFTGASAIGNSNITDSGSLITLGSNSYVNGSLGIGATSLTGFTLYALKNITGATNSYGIVQGGVVQSDVTNSANGYLNNATTAATSFTLATYRHFWANQGTFGAGSTVTAQYGFLAGNTLIGATNNYGFYGDIPSATNRWNLYMNGTASNYMAGSLGIGITVPTTVLHIVGTSQILHRYTGSPNTFAFGQFNVSGDASINNQASANLLFATANTERMRITSGGNVLVGTTDASYKFQVAADTNNFVAMIKNTNSSFGNGLYIYSPNNGSSSTNEGFLRAENGAGVKAYIYTNGSFGSATGTYGALASDIRLKENVVEASSKLDDLLKLRVVNFNLIEDTNKRKQIGFIAQEFKEVFPSLVYERDTREFDKDGNIVKGLEDSMGLSVGMEFAILVKAIQEQTQIITKQGQAIEELKALIAAK